MLGYIHSFAAATAVLGGAAVLARPKGTRAHVLAGRLYLWSMVALNISALGIYRITGSFGPFHFGALLSLATVAAGVLLLRSSKVGGVHGHAYCMLWSYLGLLAAAVSEFATHVLYWPASSGVIGTSLAVFVVGGVLVHRHGPAAIAGANASMSTGTPSGRSFHGQHR